MSELEKTMIGHLHLILGCMYSGKTSRLISIYNGYRKKGKNVCVINYKGDTRYHPELMSSHDKVMIPCHRVDNIYDVFKNNPDILETADVYLINEGQFFSDLYDVVKLLVTSHKKTVYVGGLDGDFEMKQFGQIVNLIPMSTSYEKLYAKCTNCNEKASFTKRLTEDSKQILIGGIETYIPVCRKCYND